MQKHGENMLNSSCTHNYENKNLNASSENVNRLNISCRSEKYAQNNNNSKQI
jgi:hypothetical protein